MRNFLILCALVASMSLISEAYAQSGSRGGGGGARSSGGARASSGGSRSVGGSGRRTRRPTAAEIQLAAKQQWEQAEKAAMLQAEYSQAQFKQTLSQLALRENRSANARQSRTAFKEAKNDFKFLLSRKATPEQVGVLQTPFRLTDMDIDRSSGAVEWPEVLQMELFAKLTEGIEMTISDGVRGTDSASKFFNELKELNTVVNQAAVNKTIDSSKYAAARRFVSGLANEVRATDLGDVAAK